MAKKITRDLLEKFKRRPCRGCQEINTQVLRRNIISSGVSQYFWYCIGCGDRAAQAKNIPHDVIRLWYSRSLIHLDLDEVPVLNDYRGDACVVCGEAGVQFHHFAPQAFRDLFGEEWLRWPGAYLCDYHHKKWHSVVTFYMPGPAAPHPEMLERYGAKTNVPSN